MIHLAAKSLLFLACLAAWVWRHPLVHFVTVECSHCEGWIRQDEIAIEASDGGIRAVSDTLAEAAE